MIKILGLGPGSKESLTLGTIDILKNSKHIFFRTEIHPTVKYIKELGINYVTYDDRYESSSSFDEVYESIAEDLIKEHPIYKDIVYAVPGHPLVAERSVNMLISLCKVNEIEYEIIPAVSFIDAIMESLNIDPIQGLKIIDAFDVKNQVLDKRTGIIITQVYNQYIASEVKLALSEYYSHKEEVYFIRAAGIKGMESVRKMPLYEIDRQEDTDYLTSLYIPKNLEATKDFNDLVNIMDILRGENGCPWDLEQDHKSLKKCLIEECYEVLEAIDEENENKLIEELGDVLLQVVFHAKIGNDDGYFDISDVIKSICNKMINRHPHIFSNTKVKNVEEVLDNWENIKKDENKFETYTDTLKHVPKNFPGLMRAEKIQVKAAKVGFDWDDVEPALEKVKEEYYEVKDVYKTNNRVKILDELGDLLFAVVNVARFLDIDPEEAINHTTDKFITRFEYIEKIATEKGKILQEMSLQEMDKLWEEAKNKQ